MSTSRTYAAGAVLTAAQQNDLAQGTLGYAQVTANQGSITAEVDLTSLTVTVTVVAGRRLKITGSCAFVSTVATDVIGLRIIEGAASLKRVSGVGGDTSEGIGLTAIAVPTPSAGSHTYKLTGVRAIGTGTVTMAAATNNTAFILVEDIGAV